VLGIAHRYFFYACARDESRNLPTLLPRLESIRAAANAEFSLRITIGVAVLPDASSDAMRWAAQRAVVALRQGQGLGGNRVLRFDERTMPTAYSLSGYWQTLGRLKALVYAGESTGAWAAADSAAYLIFHAHYLPLHHLRPLLASQVILLAQAMLEAGVDAETVAVLAERRLAELTADFDYVALARRLRATVDEALALVQAHRSAARRDLRQEVEAYVRTNLSDPALGLAVLADALAMSPSHLSRGCTQALGMTLTDFIHRERVSLAKGLLAGTSLSPSEVATRTGFGSYSSFAAVFRRSEGCSPTTYRAKSAQRAAK
jgi:AraC-like DNA-binding protein